MVSMVFKSRFSFTLRANAAASCAARFVARMLVLQLAGRASYSFSWRFPLLTTELTAHDVQLEFLGQDRRSQSL
jgi:hypothetical protein